MDIRSFFKIASVEIARTERQRFTGFFEIRVFYRNSKPIKGSFLRTKRSVLKREPIESSIASPASVITKLQSELIDESHRVDSEIFLSYQFFCGTVVDTSEGVLNMLC